MAKGVFNYSAVISTATDTTVVTPDATETVYVRWITAMVKTAWTSGRMRVEDGVGGGVLFRLATTVADSSLQQFYESGMRQQDGRPLSKGALLNINTSGTPGALDVDICYEVR